MFIKNKYLVPLINITLVLLIVLLTSKMTFVLNPLKTIFSLLFLPLIIALFFYYALRPVVRRFRVFKINKSLVVIFTILLFFFLFSVAFVYGGAIIKGQFQSFFTTNMAAIENLNSLYGGKIGSLVSDFEITQKSFDVIKSSLQKVTSNVGFLLSYISNISTQLILVPFILFYFLKDDDEFAKKFFNIVPGRYKSVVRDMLRQIDEVLSTYISGQLLVAFVIGGLMFIGYLIIGMPNALLMAFFSMVTSVIPFIGPFLGIIPAVLISLTIDVSMLVKVIIVAVIVQQIEGNLVTPNIIGNKLNVHPLSVIILIIVGVSLFGIIGAFISLPLYVALKVIFNSIYKAYAARKIKIN